MDTQIKPSQKYTETAMLYKVKQNVSVNFQEKKELITSFVFSICQHKRKISNMGL
ncbi:hypothetical protein [Epilithonimonas hungarica]|uniref:Uncharacterized protein n=1 Tax=Epilithonimonas hungarica TaxID=454006 RepID=A0A1G7VZ99_9FLAO|nr:hypothetical protein [Epilithonimonas hungarica]MDP9957653.1 hypothetical protein [Epilithonimonas hungarica]SDG64759.1 hypothetical protein SAMN05421825_3756 [Epilithonimonas hungarica]